MSVVQGLKTLDYRTWPALRNTICEMCSCAAGDAGDRAGLALGDGGVLLRALRPGSSRPERQHGDARIFSSCAKFPGRIRQPGSRNSFGPCAILEIDALSGANVDFRELVHCQRAAPTDRAGDTRSAVSPRAEWKCVRSEMTMAWFTPASASGMSQRMAADSPV